ncbi:MAG: DUF1849 family protein [Rhodospirillales bacterium]|nr:DUF1849 family protein [Rhodospirillales bacterium]
MPPIIFNVSLAACLAATVIAPASADVVLSPHQAVYRMALAPGSHTIDITAAEGLMVYRVARECGGWTVENHTVIRYLQEDGDTVEDKWAFVSWESEDGLGYRFRVIHKNGDDAGRIEGVASLDRAGGGGVAHYTAPEEVDVELPEGTLFPTAHLRRLIEAAQNGEKRLTRVVFDGTTEDNPYLVNVMIAPGQRQEKPLAQVLGAPPSASFWTRGAFYPYFANSETPDFEMTIQLRADGIAERMEQDFDDLGLSGTLLGVQLLPYPDC